MENITEDLGKIYQPAAALIVYKTKDNEYYLESRKIKEDGTMGAAKPVSRKFLCAIAKEYREANETTPHGLMPETMLYADSRLGKEKYIWWSEPRKVHMCFSEKVGLADGVYNMPGCVYVADSERIRVFAFEGRKPRKNQKLLMGPFFNYYSDGGICLGNARVEWSSDITWKEIQEHWEKLFWASENSHMIDNPMKEGKNLILAMKDAADKPFDTSLLKESGMTLESLLNKSK